MFKKTALLFVVIAAALNACARQADEIIMLIVPREPVPVRVGQDIALNYPTLLVTYKQTGSELEIHGWTGEKWVGIRYEDYKIGNFFTRPPVRCILVESAGMPVPQEMIPDGSWCPEGYKISSTDPRVMLHLAGLNLNFSYRTWKLYAKAYRMEIEDINPGLVNVPWWHYQAKDLSRYNSRNDELDKEYWNSLNIVSPAPVEPVVFEEETAPAVEEKEDSRVILIEAAGDDTAAVEGIEAPPPPAEVEADPFGTGDMPEAVIINPSVPKKSSWWKFWK
ncbi:MAG: hypothetical protein WC959_04250 [Kiritimatiellales bacterium]